MKIQESRDSLESRVINNSLLCSAKRSPPLWMHFHGSLSNKFIDISGVMVADNAAVCGGNILDWYVRLETYNVSNGQVWTTGKDEITIANLSILCPLFLYISFFLPFSFTILQNVISYYLDRKLVVIPREREREDNT